MTQIKTHHYHSPIHSSWNPWITIFLKPMERCITTLSDFRKLLRTKRKQRNKEVFTGSDIPGTIEEPKNA